MQAAETGGPLAVGQAHAQLWPAGPPDACFRPETSATALYGGPHHGFCQPTATPAEVPGLFSAPAPAAGCHSVFEAPLAGERRRTGLGREVSPTRPGHRAAGGGTSGPWWAATERRFFS